MTKSSSGQHKDHNGTPKKWNTPNGRSPLASFANYIYPGTTTALLDYIDEQCFPCSIKKGKLLIKAGEVCRHIYFVQQGVLRAYIKEGSKEITTWITPENEMVTSIRGFDLQLPSLENIQAIEDCELVAAHFDALQHAYTTYIEMNIVGRKLLEQYYRDAEERAFISRLTRAEARYNHFVATKGHLVNRIALKYVASYLGMTIETLSRIRSRQR